MPDEYMQHVFEPFARAKDENISKIQGTGLGLAITQNIVQMMNGTIEVQSRHGAWQYIYCVCTVGAAAERGAGA